MTKIKECMHGRTDDFIVHRINPLIEDIAILVEQVRLGKPNSKTAKKARARIAKVHKSPQLKAKGGPSTILTDMYSVAAELILNNKMADAREFCTRILQYKNIVLGWTGKERCTKNDLANMMHQIELEHNVGARIKFVADNIPCDCLSPEKYRAKMMEKINKKNWCFHCKKATTKLLTCSRCLKITFCSKECQVANWKEHKQYCQFVTGSTEADGATTAAKDINKEDKKDDTTEDIADAVEENAKEMGGDASGKENGEEEGSVVVTSDFADLD